MSEDVADKLPRNENLSTRRRKFLIQAGGGALAALLAACSPKPENPATSTPTASSTPDIGALTIEGLKGTATAQAEIGDAVWEKMPKGTKEGTFGCQFWYYTNEENDAFVKSLPEGATFDLNRLMPGFGGGVFLEKRYLVTAGHTLTPPEIDNPAKYMALHTVKELKGGQFERIPAIPIEGKYKVVFDPVSAADPNFNGDWGVVDLKDWIGVFEDHFPDSLTNPVKLSRKFVIGEGDKVWGVHFPLAAIGGGAAPIAIEAKIAKIYSSNACSIEAPSWYGGSGGPVFDDEGGLLGVVVQGGTEDTNAIMQLLPAVVGEHLKDLK